MHTGAQNTQNCWSAQNPHCKNVANKKTKCDNSCSKHSRFGGKNSTSSLNLHFTQLKEIAVCCIKSDSDKSSLYSHWTGINSGLRRCVWYGIIGTLLGRTSIRMITDINEDFLKSGGWNKVENFWIQSCVSIFGAVSFTWINFLLDHFWLKMVFQCNWHGKVKSITLFQESS